MADEMVSVDEFLNARKGFVKSGDVLMKASTGVSFYDAEAGTARFVMSTETEDRDRDIVMQAGIDLSAFEKNPSALLAHNSWDLPIGQWKDVSQILNGRPKRTEGTLVLTKGDPVADRVGLHLAAGSLRACSIGFIPKDIRRREVPEDKRESYYYPGYEILACELVECSPCAVPANPAALAKAMSEADPVVAREFVEQVLDTWAKHPENGLLVPRTEFEAAWKTLTSDRTLTSSPEERGLFSRFMKFMAGDANAAAVEQRHQADLAAAEQAESERKALEAEMSALEGRLAAKGI